MQKLRVRCERCGVEATQIGFGERSVLSVDSDAFADQCTEAVAACARGESTTVLSVRCPYLLHTSPDKSVA
jgi:hypothetical protein